MNIPLVVILIPFATFLLIFSVSALFNLYHLWHYGIPGPGLSVALTVYVCGTVFLLGCAYLFLSPVDWTQTMMTIDKEQIREGNLFQLPTVPLREYKPDTSL